ncbi:MAG: transcription antitermination factor NusB [bacterium]
MTSRRRARIWAVQQLFQRDFNPDGAERVWEALTEEHDKDEAPPAGDGRTQAFADSLVNGVIERRVEIDKLLALAAVNWKIHRMSVVDRNIMRVAICEMLLHADIPSAVTINEAIEVAKMLSDDESPRFINGVLDRVRHDLEKQAQATPASSDQSGKPDLSDASGVPT